MVIGLIYNIVPLPFSEFIVFYNYSATVHEV